MDTSGHLKVSSAAARRVTKTKARRKKGAHSRNGSKASANVPREPAAVGTLSRTKALLLAALRVWELKQRIGQ